MDVGAIAGALTGQADALARHLFPNGVLEGVEWRVGSLAGEKGRSMAIHVGRQKPGVWSDFSTGETGDALDLVAHALYRGDKRQALKWARSWLGLGTGELPATRRSAAKPKPETIAADQEKKNKLALRLWLEGEARVLGTPAGEYLKARGLDLAQLGRQPGSLRYHPALYCSEVKAKLPALVAGMVGASGAFQAVHRTWLARHDGCWQKARLIDPKKTLGRVTSVD